MQISSVGTINHNSSNSESDEPMKKTNKTVSKKINETISQKCGDHISVKWCMAIRLKNQGPILEGSGFLGFFKIKTVEGARVDKF